jgi:hypothetical protein
VREGHVYLYVGLMMNNEGRKTNDGGR